MRFCFTCLAFGILLSAALAGCRPHPKGTPEQYLAYCARCHGARGEGAPKTLRQNPAADLRASEMMRRADRAALGRRIADGYGPMPAFKRRLQPAEIERMIDFILRLREPHP